MIWHTQLGVDLGYLPAFVHEDDPRPAKEQFNEHYQHGGGWSSFKGFTLHEDNSIEYPGVPRLLPHAWTHLRDELILVYPHSWVLIKQPDGSFEVSRLD